MSNPFRRRLQRLHDAHQRGRDTDGGPSGVYSADDDGAVERAPKAPAKRAKTKTGWAALGADECNEAGGIYYRYSTSCDGGLRHGSWTIKECAGADHHGLSLLDEEVPPGVEKSQLLYMDTETSGLGERALAFMVGIGFWEDEQFVVEHLLLDELTDEKVLLQAFSERIASFDVLVTFNGKRFDVPLLARRYAKWGLDSPFLGKRHLDLLPLSRRVFPGRKRYRLSSLERDILKFRRVGDVPGRDIPPLWRRYCRDKDARPMRGVLEHNRHDIVSMAALIAEMVGTKRDGREESSGGTRAGAEASTRASTEVESRGEIASRLERSYRLRGEFAKGQRERVAAVDPQAEEFVQTRSSAKASERVKALRGGARVLIDRAMWQGAFPLICEVLALAPDDRWGLQMLARYYRQAGENELAQVIEGRQRGFDEGDG